MRRKPGTALERMKLAGQTLPTQVDKPGRPAPQSEDVLTSTFVEGLVFDQFGPAGLQNWRDNERSVKPRLRKARQEQAARGGARKAAGFAEITKRIQADKRASGQKWDDYVWTALDKLEAKAAAGADDVRRYVGSGTKDEKIARIRRRVLRYR